MGLELSGACDRTGWKWNKKGEEHRVECEGVRVLVKSIKVVAVQCHYVCCPGPMFSPFGCGYQNGQPPGMTGLISTQQFDCLNSRYKCTDVTKLGAACKYW